MNCERTQTPCFRSDCVNGKCATYSGTHYPDNTLTFNVTAQSADNRAFRYKQEMMQVSNWFYAIAKWIFPAKKAVNK